MPTWGNAAAITALPQPAKVSQNVPIASAAHVLAFMTFFLLSGENPDNQAKGHCWKPDFGQLIQGDSGQFRH
jgi:hypothetical protein